MYALTCSGLVSLSVTCQLVSLSCYWLFVCRCGGCRICVENVGLRVAHRRTDADTAAICPAAQQRTQASVDN